MNRSSVLLTNLLLIGLSWATGRLAAAAPGSAGGEPQRDSRAQCLETNATGDV